MINITKKLDKTIKSWLDTKLSRLSEVSPGIFIGGVKDQTSKFPIWLFEYNNNLYIGAEEKIHKSILGLVDRLNSQMIFSQFGMYEISRITHPLGYYVWGPSWFMFTEKESWINFNDYKIEILSNEEINNQLDEKIFWHNSYDCLKGFVIKDQGKIVASATLHDVGDNFVEIGLDTHPDAQLKGLGTNVYSAAGKWAFENNKIPYSSVGPWNIPSTRTQIKCGMKCIGVDMVGIDKFKLPPQSLGAPSKDIDIYDYYPSWAFNQNINKKQA